MLLLMIWLVGSSEAAAAVVDVGEWFFTTTVADDVVVPTDVPPSATLRGKPMSQVGVITAASIDNQVAILSNIHSIVHDVVIM